MKKDKNLFNVCRDTNFSSKNEVYKYIAAQSVLTDTNESQEIVNKLEHRETEGNIMISEHVVLPHVESKMLNESKIYIIPLKESIDVWNKETKDIKLVIAILMKENEIKIIKEKIIEFIRYLSEEAFINKLMMIENDRDLDLLLNKMKEENHGS